MTSDCNIVWSQTVLDLAKHIEASDRVDPMTALGEALYRLCNKSAPAKDRYANANAEACHA